MTELSNYKKLCEFVLARIEIMCKKTKCPFADSCSKPGRVPDEDCLNNPDTSAVKVYRTFTTEKQLAILQEIVRCTEPKSSLKIATISDDFVLSINSLDGCNYVFVDSDFSEALAGLALQLIKSGVLFKSQINRIIEEE